MLHPDDSLIFFSPIFLRKEILNHKQKIKQFTKLSEIEMEELIDLVYSKIQFIDEKLVPKKILKTADELTREIDFDDAIFIALANHLNCKLWTGDKKLMNFLKMNGFKRIISTNELKSELIQNK